MSGPRARRSLRYAAAAAAVLLLACACGSGGAGDAGPGGSGKPGGHGAGGAAGGTVTVLAAASLTDPLTALARDYETDHPGVDIALSFGSSTTLAQQVAEGAPADVVAFAGTQAMRFLPQDAAGGGGRAVVARNTMEIATPADNPGRVAALADLARPDLDVVLCASTVPCGAAADEVLAKAGVAPHVVSREVDVKATLAKVRLGEADAAVVYHSDVVSAGDAVRGVALPAGQNTTLDYPLVWLNGREHTVGFARLVDSDEGVAALTAAGFLAP